MEHEARMPIEPGPHLRVFVTAVVVQDHVDDLPGGDLRLDGVEETDELLKDMPGMGAKQAKTATGTGTVTEGPPNVGHKTRSLNQASPVRSSLGLYIESNDRRSKKVRCDPRPPGASQLGLLKGSTPVRGRSPRPSLALGGDPLTASTAPLPQIRAR